jgi:CrcB protein
VLPVLLVAAGGVLGALARHAADRVLPHEPGTWGWSTLLVNALGAALLCALLARMPDDRLRLLVGTGVLGALTTFSGTTTDAVLLADAGRAPAAAAYVVVAVVSLLAAGALGRRLAAR